MEGMTILIVEDHDILREGLTLLLEAEGYSILSAPNGRVALEKMETLSPDLILSDIAMPEMENATLNLPLYFLISSRRMLLAGR